MQTRVSEAVEREKTPKVRERSNVGRTLELCDIVVFFVGLVLGRSHLAFGAYPFGVAFLCALPHHVFVGLAGAVAGALSRGRSGILFAMVAFVALFVRILISGAEKASAYGGMFRENLTLRLSAGAIGGFVASVYELLSRGVVTESVLFSLTMIFGVALSTVAFGLVFSYPITLKGALFHTTGLFVPSLEKTVRRKKHLCIFSILCYLVVLSFGLSKIELLGVSLGGVFAFGATLLVARRFGSVCAAIVGFLSGVVIAPEFAASCALVGAVSGILFSYGNLAGEVCAVAVSALWGIYTGGALGLLTLLPEGAIGTMLMHPILTRMSPEEDKGKHTSPTFEGVAEKVLSEGIARWEQEHATSRGALALSDALLTLSNVLHKEENHSAFPSEAEYRSLLWGAMETRCKTCHFFEGCDKVKTGFFLSAPHLLEKLILHRAPEGEDVGICQDGEGREAFAESLRVLVGRVEEDRYKSARCTPVGDLVRTFGEMAREITTCDDTERVFDKTLSQQLKVALESAGLYQVEARVYGKTRRQAFVAMPEEEKEKASSPEVLEVLAKALGNVTLGAPEFLRDGKAVLMKIGTKKAYTLRTASAILPLGKEGISGDVIATYEGAGGMFRGILCDGMGSGAKAREGARFAVEILRVMLDSGVSIAHVLRLVDEVMRRRCPEDGTTLDLFSLDLYTARAEFYKLGAVTSFIKRGDSLFSIRSSSLPLGIGEGAFHGERITATVEKGDVVVLFSDGIASEPEQTPWLLELLAHTKITDPKTLAQQIILRAKEETGQQDDMSVLVCYVEGEKS